MMLLWLWPCYSSCGAVWDNLPFSSVSRWLGSLSPYEIEVVFLLQLFFRISWRALREETISLSALAWHAATMLWCEFIMKSISLSENLAGNSAWSRPGGHAAWLRTGIEGLPLHLYVLTTGKKAATGQSLRRTRGPGCARPEERLLLFTS